MWTESTFGCYATMLRLASHRHGRASDILWRRTASFSANPGIPEGAGDCQNPAMHAIEVILIMLLAVAASGYLGRLLRNVVPLPLVQIALGAGLAKATGDGVDLEPELFFLLFLPPLLFLDGWRIPKQGLFRDKGAILGLAFGLVFFTVLGMGFVIHALIPAMPLPVAFALAAILSPTDPVAVSSITARTPMPKRLMHILEGESLLNDASGLVCFQFAVAAMLTGGFSLASASSTFAWLVLVGLGAGIGFTLVATSAQRMLSRLLGEDSGAPILISLLIPFGAYILAEHLQASGILAAVAAGVTMSFVELSGRALAATRLTRAAVWDTIQYMLNGIMFVLLGEQLPRILESATHTVQEAGHAEVGWLVVYAAVIIVGLALLRFVWVWAGVRLSRWWHTRRTDRIEPVPWRLVAATSLAGVRGAVTLAGVLTLPLSLADGSSFPARDLAIFLAMVVILFSLVLASVALPVVASGLSMPPKDAEDRSEDRARREAARAAIDAVDKAQHNVSPDDAENAAIMTNAAARVIAVYQDRLRSPDALGIDAKVLVRSDVAERALRLAALRAERDCIYTLARSGQISDDLSRKLVREIDLLESRFQL